MLDTVCWPALLSFNGPYKKPSAVSLPCPLQFLLLRVFVLVLVIVVVIIIVIVDRLLGLALFVFLAALLGLSSESTQVSIVCARTLSLFGMEPEASTDEQGEDEEEQAGRRVGARLKAHTSSSSFFFFISFSLVMSGTMFFSASALANSGSSHTRMLSKIDPAFTW